MSEQSPSAAASVVNALANAQRWVSDQAERIDERIAAEEATIQELERDIQERRDAIVALEAERSLIGGGAGERAREEIYNALLAQSDELRARVPAWTAAEATRRATISEALQSDEFAQLMKDHESFENSAPDLSALPESYRAALEKVHEERTQALADQVASADPGLSELEAPDIELELVYAIEGADQAELAIFLLPVPEAAYTQWASREQDLLTLTAARMIEAIYRAMKGMNDPLAQAVAGGHESLIAVEVELAGGSIASVSEEIGTHLTEALARETELTAAKVRVSPREVPIDLLVPAEPAEEVAHAS